MQGSQEDKPSPLSLSRLSPDAIQIEWSDGKKTRYTARQLREACPCATCREKRGETVSESVAEQPAIQSLSLPVLSASEARPLEILTLRPVGNYAYNIAFSDGHRSGLFTTEFLYALGQ